MFLTGARESAQRPAQVLLWRHHLGYSEGVAPKRKERNASGLIKTEDMEYHLRCASGAKALYREEVWEDAAGKVVKYNLAFIHFGLCQQDHGRVVGYDNAHGRHERHFMGRAREVDFVSYEVMLRKFQKEVQHYRETT